MNARIAGRAIISCILLAFVGTAVLQAQSVEQWTTWGDAAMERGEYYGASRFYEGALAIDGGRMSLQWKMAEACRLSNQYDKAAELYERVQRKDQGRTHTDAMRWLGEMQLCMAQYDEAEKTWERVLRREKDKGSVIAERARNAIEGCAIARKAIANPDAWEVEHLPAPVNTYDSEFGARMGPDEALYFSSLRGELNKDGEVADTAAYRTMVLRSTATDGVWQEPEILAGTVNATGDNGNATWTLDGKHFLFTRCVVGAPCRIHIAPVLPDGSFGEARPLPGLGDELHSTQPMIAQWDGREMLLFVSDRPGGEGGTDIWQARLEEGGAVEVYPLGRPVNTAGDERTPWYDHATNTLWYSSDHLPGMGGFDIFSASFGNDAFAHPVHGGAPINSPANDLYPMIDRSRGMLWITSNRVGSLAAKGETCCSDLYRFRWTDGPEASPADTLPLATTDRSTVVTHLEEMRQRFPLKLYFHNDDPEPRSWATTTTQDYATAYRRYQDLIPEYEREGDAVALHDFFHNEVDHGYLELAKLTIALREALGSGLSITLDVRGHASPLAKSDYNLNLSMRRIASLRNHLRNVDEGALRPYLEGTAANGARLTLRTLPFGEDRAATDVSDDLADLQRSVYSVAAAGERRIEVEAITWGGDGAKHAVESQRVDIGSVRQGQRKEVDFLLRNQGTRPMRLLDMKADCGCTTAALPLGDVPPGGTVTVTVVFDGHAPVGPLSRTVVVRSNGMPERFELTIDGEVIP